MKIKKEIILNRRWVYENPEEDPVAESNFVLEVKDFLELARELFEECKEMSDAEIIDDWGTRYIPEEEGQKLYELAMSRKLVKDSYMLNIENNTRFHIDPLVPVYRAYEVLTKTIDKEDLTLDDAAIAMREAIGWLGEALA